MLMYAAGACVFAVGLLLLATLTSAKPPSRPYLVPVPLAAGVVALQGVGGVAAAALLIAVGVIISGSSVASRRTSGVIALAVGSLVIICNIIQPSTDSPMSWEPAVLGSAAALSLGLSLGLGFQLAGQASSRITGTAAVAALLFLLGFLNNGLSDLQVAGVGIDAAVLEGGGLLLIAACVAIALPVKPQLLRWKTVFVAVLIAASAGLIVVSGNENGADLALAWPAFGGLICALGLIVASDPKATATDSGVVSAIVSLVLCMALLGLWAEFWAYAPGHGPTALILGLICAGVVALTDDEGRSWAAGFGAAICLIMVAYSLWVGQVGSSWMP